MRGLAPLLAGALSAACAGLPSAAIASPSVAPIVAPPGSAAAASHPPSAASPVAATRQRAQVVRVVDGDTIRVSVDGREATVRYIGIDTPETVDPRGPVECFGREASDQNSRLVAGRGVELEKDVSETDSFGRLLRYVYVGDLMVNEELVRNGYAHAVTYPPDVKYQDRLRALEAEAREKGVGLWAPGACASPTPGPTRTPSASGAVVPTASPARSGCSPAYPTVCTPPPPPDLDCGEIPYRRFQVLAPDPHRFDGDNDGIGCES